MKHVMLNVLMHAHLYQAKVALHVLVQAHVYHANVMPYVLLHVMLFELMQAHLCHAKGNAACAHAGTFVSCKRQCCMCSCRHIWTMQKVMPPLLLQAHLYHKNY